MRSKALTPEAYTDAEQAVRQRAVIPSARELAIKHHTTHAYMRVLMSRIRKQLGLAQDTEEGKDSVTTAIDSISR